MASKKIRFEVFKRDKFTCQYCGRRPPEVVLEPDHILPESKGGKYTLENLITACFDCNRGKSDGLLTDLPDSIAINLRRIKEKRLQLREYEKYLQEVERIINFNINAIELVYRKYFGENHYFSERFYTLTVKNFLNKLPPSKVGDAMRMACLKKMTDKSHENAEETLSYFCGICWNWIKNPETRDW